MSELGQVVILNGVPRSGKTSIATVVQDTFDGLWMNLGVDGFMRMTAQRFQPGIGLRPGGELPDLEAFIPALFAGLYEATAAHSRLGLNVVIDIGHHEAYSRPLGIVADAARRLRGLPVLYVGVRCPLEVIMQRRRDTWGDEWSPGDPLPPSVVRRERVTHEPGIYDMEVDTSKLTPEACAEAIRERLQQGPPSRVFQGLAAS